MSDVEYQQDLIDILISADVAGKLLTGKKYQLSNGLTAFETLLGWTIMCKLPAAQSEVSESAVIFTNMLSHEADISELWRLDVLGITDLNNRCSNGKIGERRKYARVYKRHVESYSGRPLRSKAAVERRSRALTR